MLNVTSSIVCDPWSETRKRKRPTDSDDGNQMSSISHKLSECALKGGFNRFRKGGRRALLTLSASGLLFGDAKDTDHWPIGVFDPHIDFEIVLRAAQQTALDAWGPIRKRGAK